MQNVVRNSVNFLRFIHLENFNCKCVKLIKYLNFIAQVFKRQNWRHRSRSKPSVQQIMHQLNYMKTKMKMTEKIVRIDDKMCCFLFEPFVPLYKAINRFLWCSWRIKYSELIHPNNLNQRVRRWTEKIISISMTTNRIVFALIRFC